MGKTGEVISLIAVGVIGLAIVAVLVAQKANTSSVISAATGGFANILGAAIAPVTGSTLGTGLSNSAGLALP